MPKRRVYQRDSRGRFSKTGKSVHVAGRKGKYPGGKLTGTPVSKGSLPIVERYPGGHRNSRALQKQLKAEGWDENSTVIKSFNFYNGGFTPDRRGNGTYNFVARDSKSRKVIGTGMVNAMSAPARGYERTVSVNDLFKVGGRKAKKGTGASMLSAMAKTAQGRDLKGYKPTDFRVGGAVPGAKKFYSQQGGSVSRNSSVVNWTTRGRNKLAGKRNHRLKIMPSPTKKRTGRRVK